jgi:hypothetical protein
LKDPADLSDVQAVNPQEAEAKRGRAVACLHIEGGLTLRGVFVGELGEAEVGALLDRSCSRPSRSGLRPFVMLAKTVPSSKKAYWLRSA